jgi:hypothetical protein
MIKALSQLGGSMGSQPGNLSPLLADSGELVGATQLLVLVEYVFS